MINKIMVIDDDEKVALSISSILEREGYKVAVFSSASHAMSVLDVVDDVDLILTDKSMPGVTGMDLLKFVLELKNPMPVILITGHGDVDTAVEAMKAGASDFLCKPVSQNELLVRVKKVLEKHELSQEINALRKRLETTEGFEHIVGKSRKMLQVYDLIESVAKTDVTVLIRGETGTGKELVAQAIHGASDRSDKPFVAVCCTALQKTLLESELFGHEKGAFTGAHATKIGKLESAGDGTFLLDEVGDTSADIQAKLLRVLQEREFDRVGGLKPIKLNARILASTNTDLEKAVREDRFREDLYYRLNVVEIDLPPLREREDDILRIAEHLLAGFKKRYDKQIEGFTPAAVEKILEYSWPGNVRELQNVLERTVLTCSRRWIDKLAGLPGSRSKEEPRVAAVSAELSYVQAKEQALQELEKTYLLHYMNDEKGVINKVAERMGVNVRTINRLLNKHEIDKVKFKQRAGGNA